MSPQDLMRRSYCWPHSDASWTPIVGLAFNASTVQQFIRSHTRIYTWLYMNNGLCLGKEMQCKKTKVFTAADWYKQPLIIRSARSRRTERVGPGSQALAPLLWCCLPAGGPRKFQACWVETSWSSHAIELMTYTPCSYPTQSFCGNLGRFIHYNSETVF